MTDVSIAHPWIGLARPLTRVWGLMAGLGSLRCRLFHGQISRPVNGHYRCWTCLREFRAGW
jgi:hypothetical protein